MSTDTRIVYGATCVWWGGIEDIGRLKGPAGVRLPCCPHCGGVLFEMASPEEWWRSVDAFQAQGRDGYRAFTEWARGKCFPDLKTSLATYENEDRPNRFVKGMDQWR